MTKKVLFLYFTLIPVLMEAAGPPSDPQIYSLTGQDQVVMLSNGSDGKVFSSYEDYRKSTEKFYQPNQTVWVWCDGKDAANTIEKIEVPEGGEGITTLTLKTDPACKEKPLLLSNHQFPKQTWTSVEASPKEIEGVGAKLSTSQSLVVTKITTSQKGTFFLVFDPGLPSIYDTGGYRLLDDEMKQISTVDTAPMSPLIDLDGDGVPEFFVPSSDGLDAWLYRLFPRVDREMSYR